MVGGVGGQNAGVILFQTAHTMLEALPARDGPAADKGFGVALEGMELAVGSELGCKRRFDFRVIGHRGDSPGLTAVSEEAFAEQDDRSHVLHGYLGGVEGSIEAVARGMGRHDGHRALAVTAIEGLVQVGLLSLGGDTGGGACPLHIDYHKRELGHHRKAKGFALEREAGAGSGGNGQAACVCRAYCRTDAGDFVFRLEGLGAKVFVDCQLFQDGSGGSDGIGAAEEGQTALLARRQQTPCRGLVAGDVTVEAGLRLGRGHMIGIGHHLEVRGVVEAVFQNLLVGGDDLGVLLRELLLQIVEDVVERALEDEAGHAEGEHVLALVHRLLVHAALFQALLGEGGDGGDDEVTVFHSKLREGVVGFETGLLHESLGERVGVHKDAGCTLAPFGVGLEGRRVHGDEHVAEVAGSVHVGASYVHLETGNAGYCAVRGAYLGGIVRESRKGIAKKGRGIGKKSSGELHAVTGISCKPYHNIFGIDYLMLHYSLGM